VPVTWQLPGPLPAFVAAVDADPRGERIAVVVGSSDAGVRVAVLDVDGRLVFLRDGPVSPAGAVVVDATRVAVAAPDDPHRPGASLRVHALTPARDRATVLGARAQPPLRRVPLGDVAAIAIDLAPAGDSVAVAVVGLVDQRGAVVVDDGTTTRTVPLPFAPSALVFHGADHVVVGGAGGTLDVDVATGRLTPHPGPPVTALFVVDGTVRTAHGPAAIGVGGSLWCVDGAPVWQATSTTSPTSATSTGDGLPCARFSGGAVLVGASHGLEVGPTVTVWR